MEGDLDPFDYMLASELGMTIKDMHDAMPNNEYLSWRAFFTYRTAMQDLALKEQRRGR